MGGGGLTIGWALFSKEHGTHVFEVPQDKYEAGLDKAIAENAHRSFQKWVVRAKVEPELEDHEAKLAEEIDALKAQVAGLKAANDDLANDFLSAGRMIEQLSAGQKPPGTLPVPQSYPQAPIEQQEPAPVIAPAGEPSPRSLAHLTRDNQATEASWTELRAVAKERGIDLTKYRSRPALVDALWPLEPAGV